MKTFESLYRDYYQKVYAFLNRMCADGDLAEDLTQETFLQAINHSINFGESVRFLPGLQALASIPISNI